MSADPFQSNEHAGRGAVNAAADRCTSTPMREETMASIPTFRVVDIISTPGLYRVDTNWLDDGRTWAKAVQVVALARVETPAGNTVLVPLGFADLMVTDAVVERFLEKSADVHLRYASSAEAALGDEDQAIRSWS